VKTKKGTRKTFKKELDDIKQYDLLGVDLHATRETKDDMDKALQLLEDIAGIK
jgi:hypothetical protein